jgi:hypothetical protein
MASFYGLLKKGLPKDIAMQQAKIAFIRSKGHADAHPFYWGSFICIGDMRPVSMPRESLPWPLWGIMTLGGGLFLFFLIKMLRRLGTVPD